MLRRALAITKNRYGEENARVAIALGNLAELLRAQHKLAEAVALFRRALAILKTVHGGGHPEVASALGDLALALRAQSKLAEAEPLLREVRERERERSLSARERSLSDPRALGCALEALAIHKKALGVEHPQVARSLNNLAELLRAQDKHAEADELFRRARSISADCAPPGR